MTEFELIAKLTKDLPPSPQVIAGPGDDCAILDLGLPDRWLLFKTDAIVEQVHFLPDADPVQIGHKALARPLSDIAAMGGIPTSAVVTLGLPPHPSTARIEAVYQGLRALADRTSVHLVGGETVTNPGGLLLSVALLGWVEKNRCVRRQGAQPNDAIFVTGELGGSIGGHHLSFEPRLRESRWLTEHFPVHAMIDVSDGLAGDLRHLLTASALGAELRADSLPIRRFARAEAASGRSAKPATLAALTDGEDYELLFTVSPSDAVRLQDGFRQAFPEVPIRCIGRITAAPGLRLRDKNGVHTFHAHGYDHLAQP